jgi:hypothetical protein
MSTPTIYVANSIQMVVIVVGALALTLTIVLACCSLVNLIARRPVLNGWLWGTATVTLLLTYHLAIVYTTTAAEEQSAAVTGDDFILGIPILLLLAIATWRAVAWRRRNATPRT